MARTKKKVIAEKVEEPKVETPVVEAPVAPTPKVEEPVNIHYPIVDNVQVVEILEDGRETEDFYHCKMADGTTRHVEKKLFS